MVFLPSLPSTVVAVNGAVGQSSVTLVGPGGKQTKVPVTPGMSDNG